MTPSSPGHENDPQYLTFQLHDGTYGIEIESISEIRAIGAVTPLPGSPAYVRGIMNLRGAIVPVVDLRARLGLPIATAHNRFAVTIITKHQNKSIGLVADGVNEVISIPKTSWQNSKALEHADQRFIHGLALLPTSPNTDASTASMIVLLNLNRLYDPALHSLPQPNASMTLEQESANSLAALHHEIASPTHPLETSQTEITA